MDEEHGGFWHRMGDVGYRDEIGRIWFCGRKSHRVCCADNTLFTIPCEAIFNNHAAVFRSALVGIQREGGIQPVMCVELLADVMESEQADIRSELLSLAAASPITAMIDTVLFHPEFPVDIRHNAKIFREKLVPLAIKALL
jgi:acyl-coenzyme A synthetase/AMP-(fatty) acid ligase